MTNFITIPKWRPAALNELLRGRWKSAALKKRDREFIATYAKAASIPKATGKRRVTLAITLGKRQNKADIDAYQKSTLDALVKCGMLIDDRGAFCEWGGVIYTRSDEPRTVIVLEDLP